MVYKRYLASAFAILATHLQGLETLETYSQIDLRYRAPEGVGYKEGYASADLFLATSLNGGPLFFFNPRGHLFDDGSTAANAGIGLRYDLGKCGLDGYGVGANIYYDFRAMPKDLRKQFHTTFHRIGLGAEVLSRCWDIRVNGYLPIGRKELLSKAAFSYFAGHNAFATQLGVASLSSVDGEIGAPFNLFNPVNFYFSAGSYYLFERTVSGHHFGDAVGGKARIEASLSDWLTLAISATHDRLFETRVQGVVSITFAIGGRDSSGCSWSTLWQQNYCRDRRLQRVRREEIIPIERRQIDTPINGCDGTPQHIIFVNNDSPAAGDGTFENPYTILKVAESSSQPDDIIYVFPGDGTDSRMDMGIELQEGQRLIGSGVSFAIGEFFIPAQTPGLLPHITNSGGVGVLLSVGSNEVSGFLIDDVTQGMQGSGVGSLYCIGQNEVNAVNEAISLDLSEGSLVFIQGNELGSSGGTAVLVTSDQSSVVFEDNVLGALFRMEVEPTATGPSVLRARGNLRSATFDPTFELSNSSSSENFLVEVEDPANGIMSFESANQGTLSISDDPVLFVPLFSEIAEKDCDFCQSK